MKFKTHPIDQFSFSEVRHSPRPGFSNGPGWSLQYLIQSAIKCPPANQEYKDPYRDNDTRSSLVKEQGGWEGRRLQGFLDLENPVFGILSE